MMAGQSLEPHGLHSPKAHLCEYGNALLKNALAHKKAGTAVKLFRHKI